MNTKYLSARLKRYHANMSLAQGYELPNIFTFQNNKKKTTLGCFSPPFIIHVLASLKKCVHCSTMAVHPCIIYFYKGCIRIH